MAVTGITKKKARKALKSVQRRQSLKNNNFKPVLKNIDVEAIKKSFREGGSDSAE